MMATVQPFYVATGPSTFLSTPSTAGPWGPDSQHGGPPAALLTRAVETLPLSGRGRARVARVAATIAALAGADAVETSHVAEALSYRVPKELRGP